MFERHGLSVIPVPRPGKYADGKRPAILWREYQTRLPTEAEMRGWFERGRSNYAVVTGKTSGIVVIDVDDKKALPWLRWNLEATPWIVKTSKGWHCYYKYPRGAEVGNRARVSGMKIDVRGEGGYVIGPGSVHVSGFMYRFVGDWKVHYDRVPTLDVSILQGEAPRLPEPARPRPQGSNVERARAYLKRVPVPVVGHGSDHATFIAACRLVRGFRIPEEQAVDLLKEWAPKFDAWWLRRKVSTALAHGKETPGGLL